MLKILREEIMLWLFLLLLTLWRRPATSSDLVSASPRDLARIIANVTSVDEI